MCCFIVYFISLRNLKLPNLYPHYCTLDIQVSNSTNVSQCFSKGILYIIHFNYTFLILGLMVLTFWLLTGTIGFFAAYSFIRKIYSAVKIDWFLYFIHYTTRQQQKLQHLTTTHFFGILCNQKLTTKKEKLNSNAIEYNIHI